jgi:hypothetical protein
LGQESVDFAAGGIEGTLLLLRAIVNERATVLVNRLAEKRLSSLLSERRVIV